VATPIGNLRDITLRALDTLRSVALIACEDTRRTRILLQQYQITVPSVSYHDHSPRSRLEQLLRQLHQGQSVALVTDSGMPLIADPGYPLVRQAIQEGVRVEVIPGPSACLSALVLSGLPAERFVFEGYLPQKRAKRRRILEALQSETRTAILYESPYRIKATLEDCLEVLGDRELVLCRELTKTFEEVLRGPIRNVLAELHQRTKLGELVIVLGGASTKR